MSWPEEYGGRGCDLIEWLIFEEEYYRAGAPARVNQNGIFLLGPTLMEFGTPEQKERFLPKMATRRGGVGAGLVRARAPAATWRRSARARERDGEHCVLNGQKTWSTRARVRRLAASACSAPTRPPSATTA